MEIPSLPPRPIPADAIISVVAPRRLCGPGKDGRERFRRNAGFHSATSKSWRAYWQGATVGTRPQRHVIVILFLLLSGIRATTFPHATVGAFLCYAETTSNLTDGVSHQEMRILRVSFSICSGFSRFSFFFLATADYLRHCWLEFWMIKICDYFANYLEGMFGMTCNLCS